jgi:Ca-activated chloride channel family protein
LVDGKELPGKLLSKEEARRRYEEIVRKNQDPALVGMARRRHVSDERLPRAAGTELAKVQIRYTQLCRQADGVTDFLFPLATAKYTTHPVEKVSVRLNIESTESIKSVYSPTHDVDVKRRGKNATITYSSKNEVPTSDFRLLFDVGRGKLSARVLSYRPKGKDDGFFLLLANPQIEESDEESPPKTVVFVVDKSGSMSGEKIEQARNALKFVLQRLREGDLFNIITYDDRVEQFKPELQRYNDKTKAEALGFAESIYAGGSTNIEGALTTALKQLKDSDRPNYVLFLTDGLPTAGETNEAKIVEAAKSNNRVRARIIAFGVGYDVNSRLLDKLVRENFGQSEYVRPNEDIEERVAKLYARMESPVLTGVKLEFCDEEVVSKGPVVNRVYPKGEFDLFAGEQLVIVGRYRRSGSCEVRVNGSVGKDDEEFKFPAKLAKESDDESLAFIEKLWATRRIGEIIDQLDLKGKNEELTKELVELSTRHGILTQYTSFLADETVRIDDVTSNAVRTESRLKELEQVSGQGGFVQRGAKASMQAAQNAAPAAAPTADAFSAGERSAGVASTAPLSLSTSNATYRDSRSDKQVAIASVRNLGTKSFYWRENRWQDSTVTDEQIKAAKRYEQFSDEYFKLAEKHGRTLSQYLVYDEPVLLNLAGETLLIEPAKTK